MRLTREEFINLCIGLPDRAAEERNAYNELLDQPWEMFKLEQKNY